MQLLKMKVVFSLNLNLILYSKPPSFWRLFSFPATVPTTFVGFVCTAMALKESEDNARPGVPSIDTVDVCSKLQVFEERFSSARTSDELARCVGHFVSDRGGISARREIVI